VSDAAAAESYPVSVEAHNDHGMRFGPHEQYALTISDDDVTLRPTYATSIVQDGGDGDVIVRWRLAEIRKLKCESVSNGNADLITLVATRSAEFFLYSVKNMRHHQLHYLLESEHTCIYASSRGVIGPIGQTHTNVNIMGVRVALCLEAQAVFWLNSKLTSKTFGAGLCQNPLRELTGTATVPDALTSFNLRAASFISRLNYLH